MILSVKLQTLLDPKPGLPLLVGVTQTPLFTIPSSPRRKTLLKLSKKLTVKSVRATADKESGTPVRVVAVVGDGSISPLKSTPWYEVMIHTAQRLKWVDEGYDMQTFTDEIREFENLQKELKTADILLIIAVKNQESANWIQTYSENIPNILCFDSSPIFKPKYGGSLVQTEPKNGNLFTKIPLISRPKKNKESVDLIKTVSDAWKRQNTDDIIFCLLVIINAYIQPVPILQNLRAQGFSTLNCMVKNCGSQILNCLLDPDCRKALECLNKCSPVDQVCNYRCLASYESPIFEQFSLCVLQKHNCLYLDAMIPQKPHVKPMARFRGQDLSHESAEDLFIGWLGKNSDFSWRVIAGQNPAYDQFPCQYQLFYRGKARGSFWYEPVFQVQTLDDNLVWRRRKYRVKRGKTVGTFNFTVLDNGVVSSEFWTLVEVADDFSWGLFHYKGAARVAGQSYIGAVLVSPTGQYPDSESERKNLVAALERCCIKEWELFDVDNCACEGAPLGLPEGSRFHSVVEVSP